MLMTLYMAHEILHGFPTINLGLLLLYPLDTLVLGFIMASCILFEFNFDSCNKIGKILWVLFFLDLYIPYFIWYIMTCDLDRFFDCNKTKLTLSKKASPKKRRKNSYDTTKQFLDEEDE